jgi:thiol:disulfide interchange protein DsbD
MEKRNFIKSLSLSVLLCLLTAWGHSPQETGWAGESETVRIRWLNDIKNAFILAERENKPVMVEFMAEWCPSCRAMEDSTFRSPAVVEKMNGFVPVRIDVDRQKGVTARYKASARKYGGIGIPNFLFMTKEGKKIRHRVGYMEARLFVSELDSVLSEVK